MPLGEMSLLTPECPGKRLCPKSADYSGGKWA